MSEVYIKVDKKTNIITFVHRMPFDPINGLGKTRDELLKTGYFVSNFPEPAMKLGKRAIPYYDYEKKEVTYEYTNIPLSEKERLDLLESAMNDMILASISKEEETEEE